MELIINIRPSKHFVVKNERKRMRKSKKWQKKKQISRGSEIETEKINI